MHLNILYTIASLSYIFFTLSFHLGTFEFLIVSPADYKESVYSNGIYVTYHFICIREGILTHVFRVHHYDSPMMKYQY